MPVELSAADMLLMVDTALVVAGAIGYVLMKRMRPTEPFDIKSAYAVLDRSITRYVPTIGDGFTWNEAFKQLKEAGVEADWKKMEKHLSEYEAYRYGGREAPNNGQEDVISLALRLRRTLVGIRAKGKSA
ncbi:MAG: hypothetical protein JRN18_00145 [Nitrososphaerota archaeon]|nr:hypothetical protein [Nitrososphaerota archaeon]MDG6916448.1 hypothetical protein [Nitrososphaerota archaeon]MDG6918837.1 hypothetical protein [Nitrososphaerota archaeon]MDG6946547.1 hypothetical protein [Nitrososphaerota archaeon]MDG6947704.1 hypothetical protein [Nitrososphaerota archaeon]